MIEILVVDDQEIEELNLNSLFFDNGLKVHTTFGSQNGLDIAKRYLPDLVICNLETDNEGCQFVEKLVRCEQTQNIPIIYLSSIKDFNNQRRLMNCGADDYIIKPFNEEELLQAVKCRLKKQKSLKDKMLKMCRESLEIDDLKPKRNDHILVTIGKRLQLIKYKDIVCITAQKEYSKFKTYDGQSIVVRKSLKRWEDILPAKNFLRIHRSTIINVEAIQRIIKIKERTYVVYLESLKEPLEFSQRYSNVMRKTFPS